MTHAYDLSTWKLRQEDHHEFRDNIQYIVRPGLRKPQLSKYISLLNSPIKKLNSLHNLSHFGFSKRVMNPVHSCKMSTLVSIKSQAHDAFPIKSMCLYCNESLLHLLCFIVLGACFGFFVHTVFRLVLKPPISLTPVCTPESLLLL